MEILKTLILFLSINSLIAAPDYSFGRHDEIIVPFCVQERAGQASDKEKKERTGKIAERVDHAINSQTQDICEAMKEHSESKAEFSALVVVCNGDKGEAMIQFCYRCSKETFKYAVKECHRALTDALHLAATEEIRKAILTQFELHDGIKAVLSIPQDERYNGRVANSKMRVSVFES